MAQDTLNVTTVTVPQVTISSEPPSTALPTVAVQPPPPPAPAPHATQDLEHTVAAVAKQIESYLRSIGRSLEFYVDTDTGRTVVTVRDAETGEVIRQIPPEEVQRLSRTLGTQPNALVDLLA